jgi:uncharacterized protein (TIGR03067 family)
MKSLAWILCLGLGCLLSVGCGNPAGTGGGNQSEAERKAAEEAARVRRFDDLLGNGKKALETKRFAEAVEDFEEAVRLRDDPRARELLQQAQKSRLNGLWLLSRQEDRDSSLIVKGLTEGLLFEGDKVTAVRAMKGDDLVARGGSGSYTLDVSKNPKTIDVRWDKVGEKAVTQLGIYKLEKEKLTISWSEPGEKERPQEFNRDRAEVRYYVRVDREKK